MPVEDKSCHDLLHCSHRPRCLIESVQSLIVRRNNTHDDRPYIYRYERNNQCLSKTALYLIVSLNTQKLINICREPSFIMSPIITFQLGYKIFTFSV